MPNEELKYEIEDLKRQLRDHVHNGADAKELSINNLVDLIPTVSTAPSHTPRRFADQFRIYSNGVTYRLYWYDAVNAAWRYATGT